MLAKTSLKTIAFATTALLISACGGGASDSQPNQAEQSAPQVLDTSKKVTTQNSEPAKKQTEQTKPNTAHQISSLIFTDAKLANCVNQQAKQHKWQTSQQITSLTCPNKGIENLGGLQNLTQLQKLDLSLNQIAILASLTSLTELKQLNLAGNTIVDVAPLASLNKLVNLNLGPGNKLNRNTNSIRDISPLANLSALQQLNINYNQISDISALASLNNLVTLALSHNQIRQIDHLQAFSHIQNINLTGNDNINCAALNELQTNLYQGKLQRPSDCLFTLDILIVDIRFADQQLQSCLLNTASSEGWIAINEVTALSCEQHNIQTLSGIENLKALTQLDLSANQITDISPLLALTNAQINLQDNSQIACARLDALQASLGQHAINRPNQCAQLSLLSDLNFADVAIESCVTYTANLYQWQAISEMTSLHCPSELTIKIAQLDDLQQLTALNSVHIGSHISQSLNCQTLDAWQQQYPLTLDKPAHCH